jgi:hypothetical protein
MGGLLSEVNNRPEDVAGLFVGVAAAVMAGLSLATPEQRQDGKAWRSGGYSTQVHEPTARSAAADTRRTRHPSRECNASGMRMQGQA